MTMKYNLTDTVRDMQQLKLLLIRADRALRVIEIIEALQWDDTSTNRSRVSTLLTLIGATSDRHENGRRGYGKYRYRVTEEDCAAAAAILGLKGGQMERLQTAETQLEEMGFEWSPRWRLWKLQRGSSDGL